MIHRFFNFLRQSLLTVLLVVLLTLLAAGGWYLYQGHQLYKSVTYAMPVSTLYDTIRTHAHYAAYSELPQTYINAVISTEDEHFLTHKGIDPGAILRALAADIRSRSLAEGGSTLTQQLAKNALFTQEKRLTRKAAEALLPLTSKRPTPNSRSLRCTPTPSISAMAAMASRRPPRVISARRPPSSRMRKLLCLPACPMHLRPMPAVRNAHASAPRLC